MHLRSVWAATAVIFSAVAAAQSASTGSGQAYPVKPVRVVLASGAGGSVDGLTRLFARKITDTFGQPYVVENRPGGGGIPGFTLVAKSAPVACRTR